MIIGLTGGIGSGKSSVSNELKRQGCFVLDADAIYSELTAKGMPLLDKLTEEFGDILSPDGNLDRKKLSNTALGNPRLNEITHKAVGDEIRRRIDESDSDTVFLDVPLLFESGLDKQCDMVWTVSAPEAVRIERVKKRDGLLIEEIKKRISLQMSEEEKIKRSDIVIYNDSSIEELEKKVKELLNGSKEKHK